MLDFFKILKNIWFSHNSASLDEKFFNQDYKTELGNFAPYYIQHIRPLVEGFETHRLRRLGHLITCRWIALLCIVIAFYFNIWTIVFILVFMPYIPIYLYSCSIEKYVFPLIFKFFDEKATYEVIGDFKSSYSESGIVPYYNRSNMGNYIALDYKEVRIELLETELIHETQVEKNEKEVLVFKGLTIILSMNKPFHGKTLIKKDPNTFGKLFEKIPNGWENVKLEDSAFGSLFEVYSSDQIEARYLLTSSFMQNLLKISKSLGDKDAQCSFFNNKLFMMFEMDYEYFAQSSIFSPATFIEASQSIIEHMNAICTMIDTVKLRQNTKL